MKYDAIAILSHTVAANTVGGAFTSGAWTKRTLNTEDYDPDGLVSLASSQLTLDAGTYEIEVRNFASDAAYMKWRVRNVTDGATVALGQTGYNLGVAPLFGVFTLSGTKTLEVQYRSDTGSGSTEGLGLQNNDGEANVHCLVIIRRLSTLADQKISDLSALTSLVGTEEFVVADSGTSKKIAASAMSFGGGGWYSPVDEPPASPDAFDDEFDDSASLAGSWTAYGDALTAVDINTTVPGRLYFRRAAGAGGRISGYYKAIPAFPSTILIKQGASNCRENYHRGNHCVILPAGAISNSSPLGAIGQLMAGGYEILGETRSDLATFASTVYQGGAFGADFTGRAAAFYFRFTFNSTTSVHVDISYDGIAWQRALTAWNPLGAAMGQIGFGMSLDAGTTYGAETSWDYIRRLA